MVFPILFCAVIGYALLLAFLYFATFLALLAGGSVWIFRPIHARLYGSRVGQSNLRYKISPYLDRLGLYIEIKGRQYRIGPRTRYGTIKAVWLGILMSTLTTNWLILPSPSAHQALQAMVAQQRRRRLAQTPFWPSDIPLSFWWHARRLR